MRQLLETGRDGRCVKQASIRHALQDFRSAVMWKDKVAWPTRQATPKEL